MAADPSLIAQAEGQLGALMALQRKLDAATPATLAMIRADIAATVAASQSLAQQARAAGSSAGASSAADLGTASQAARATVNDFTRDFYERKIFDPYLKFSSAEDEEKYRRDEAERRKQIEQALALHTPEGDLRANTLAIEQLKDAGAHGADQSPAYQETLAGLVATRDQLSAQIEASSHSEIKQARTDAVDAPAAKDAASVALPPGLLSTIQAAKMKVADQHQEGHGLTQRQSGGSSTPGLS